MLPNCRSHDPKCKGYIDKIKFRECLLKHVQSDPILAIVSLPSFFLFYFTLSLLDSFLFLMKHSSPPFNSKANKGAYPLGEGEGKGRGKGGRGRAVMERVMRKVG